MLYLVKYGVDIHIGEVPFGSLSREREAIVIRSHFYFSCFKRIVCIRVPNLSPILGCSYIVLWHRRTLHLSLIPFTVNSTYKTIPLWKIQLH